MASMRIRLGERLRAFCIAESLDGEELCMARWSARSRLLGESQGCGSGTVGAGLTGAAGSDLNQQHSAAVTMAMQAQIRATTMAPPAMAKM